MVRYVTSSYSQREKIFLSLTANQEVSGVSASYSQLHSIPKSVVGTPIFDSYHTAVAMSGSVQNSVTLEGAASMHQGKERGHSYQAYDDSILNRSYETGEIGGSGHAFYNAPLAEPKFDSHALHLGEVVSPGGLGGTGHIFDDIKLPQKLDNPTLVSAKEGVFDEGGGIAGTGHVIDAPLSSVVNSGGMLGVQLPQPDAAPVGNVPGMDFPEVPGGVVDNVTNTDSLQLAGDFSVTLEITTGLLEDPLILEYLDHTICPGIGFNDDGTTYFILPNIDTITDNYQFTGFFAGNDELPSYEVVNLEMSVRYENALDTLNINDKVDQSVYLVV